MDPELTKAVRCLRQYHWYNGPRLLPPGVITLPQRYVRPAIRPEQEPSALGAELTSDQEYTFAAGRLLNYFDSIAIGIEQRFYVKEICREHIGPIFVAWMGNLRSVDSVKFDKQMKESFARLPTLWNEWRR